MYVVLRRVRPSAVKWETNASWSPLAPLTVEGRSDEKRRADVPERPVGRDRHVLAVVLRAAPQEGRVGENGVDDEGQPRVVGADLEADLAPVAEHVPARDRDALAARRDLVRDRGPSASPRPAESPGPGRPPCRPAPRWRPRPRNGSVPGRRPERRRSRARAPLRARRTSGPCPGTPADRSRGRSAARRAARSTGRPRGSSGSSPAAARSPRRGPRRWRRRASGARPPARRPVGRGALAGRLLGREEEDRLRRAQVQAVAGSARHEPALLGRRFEVHPRPDHGRRGSLAGGRAHRSSRSIACPQAVRPTTDEANPRTRPFKARMNPPAELSAWAE